MESGVLEGNCKALVLAEGKPIPGWAGIKNAKVSTIIAFPNCKNPGITTLSESIHFIFIYFSLTYTVTIVSDPIIPWRTNKSQAISINHYHKAYSPRWLRTWPYVHWKSTIQFAATFDDPVVGVKGAAESPEISLNRERGWAIPRAISSWK